ncbi:Mitochondrial inner membrane protein oxa1 [Arachnomyces sp. PD_36]|nr:Mitochondrial inner membrane protein oxa1 [Arachnomyces sp. PD_36]
MLGGTGLRRSAAAAATIRQRASLPIRSQRSLSSFATRTTQSPLRASSISSLNTFRRTPSPTFSRLASAPFSSTAVASTGAGISNANTSEAASAGNPGESPFVADLSDIDLSLIPEKIGYLKELGLDYGLGPTSVMQFLLEHIHIYTGIPWWGSVIALAAVIRVGLFQPSLKASDTAVKLQQVKPLLDPIKKRMSYCVKNGDNTAALQERQKMNLINQEHGIKPWLSFFPMIQIPLGFGCYRMIHGMSSLPIPALETESFLWLTDLTAKDPTFMLPIATGALMYYTMKRGGETGMAGLLNTPFGRAIIYIIPAISVIATGFFPSLLQLYFFASAVLSTIQNVLITSPSFRRLTGISPLVTVRPPGADGGLDANARRLRLMADQAALERALQERSQAKPVSFIDRAVDNFKSGTEDLRKEAMSKMDEFAGTNNKNADGSPKAAPRRTKREIEAANDYEKKRREEAEWLRQERNMQRREQYKKTNRRS